MLFKSTKNNPQTRMFCYTYYSSVLSFVDSFYQFAVKAYERTVECFKLLNRSQFATSSAISSLVS